MNGWWEREREIVVEEKNHNKVNNNNTFSIDLVHLSIYTKIYILI
jgi:hypothetical protein